VYTAFNPDTQETNVAKQRKIPVITERELEALRRAVKQLRVAMRPVRAKYQRIEAMLDSDVLDGAAERQAVRALYPVEKILDQIEAVAAICA
jgi:hypothetical protein